MGSRKGKGREPSMGMIPNETPAAAGAQEGLWSISDTLEFIQPQGKGAELLYFCSSHSLDGLFLWGRTWAAGFHNGRRQLLVAKHAKAGEWVHNVKKSDMRASRWSISCVYLG